MIGIERVLSRAVLGFLGLKLVVLAVNARTFPVLGRFRSEPRNQRGADGNASLLVPARDEAHNLRRTLATLLAQPVREVLVLDDGSQDATAEIVSAAARTDPRLRLFTGATLPEGWTGKNWACHQLAAAATGDPLVFCDADVSLAPDAVAAVQAEMDRQRADVFSVFPQQQTGTLGERVLLPLIDDVLLTLLPFPLLDQPVPDAATANGQLLAFRRDAYEQLGGHASVRSSIVEDVRLARNARHEGLRLGLALGGEVVQVRMYEGYAATVAGLAKSLLAAHGGSRVLLGSTAAWHVLAYTVPWLRPTRRVWQVAAVLGLVERLGVNAKTGRRAWAEALLTPVAPLAALPVFARAARRGSTWKGRTYP